MTVVHTYFYIAVDTQRGCHTLKKLYSSTFKHYFMFPLNIDCCWHAIYHSTILVYSLFFVSRIPFPVDIVLCV